MAITTYSELQTAAANWLDRTDLTARIIEAIALFEANINRKITVRQQITTTTLTPSGGTASLPNDYLLWKRVTWNGSPKRELEYVDSSYFQQAYPDSPSDTPRFFTIEGSTLRIAPLSDTTLTLAYAQKVPALSDSATTNWLLTAHPDGYLFGTLEAVKTLTVGDAERPMAIAAFDGVVTGLVDQLKALTFAQSGPAMVRAYGATP